MANARVSLTRRRNDTIIKTGLSTLDELSTNEFGC